MTCQGFAQLILRCFVFGKETRVRTYDAAKLGYHFQRTQRIDCAHKSRFYTRKVVVIR